MEEVRLTEKKDQLNKQRETFVAKVTAKGYNHSNLQQEKAARITKRDEILNKVQAILNGQVTEPIPTTQTVPGPAPVIEAQPVIPAQMPNLEPAINPVVQPTAMPAPDLNFDRFDPVPTPNMPYPNSSEDPFDW